MGKPYSPKGLRISDEVHRALRIRAAETGESMGAIAERALRKELGLPMERKSITYYIPGRVGGRDYYVRLDGPGAELIPAENVEVDPFSRVAAPPLKADWADDLGLADEDRRSFEASEVAYTRAHEA